MLAAASYVFLFLLKNDASSKKQKEQESLISGPELLLYLIQLSP
jgi:hypothetical protein